MDRTPRHPNRRGFTLTELLVVIALIVLLVGLLLAALGQVQQKARQTTTTATMQSFANACETFRQEHGFYPGFVPEAVLDEDPKITGTENALVHLMGGYARLEDYADGDAFNAAAPLNGGWVPFNFGTGPYVTRVSLARIGQGPIIRDKPYAPYFTPSDKEFGAVEGQLDDPQKGGNAIRLPDLVDAWGQPIIYLRALRSIGPITDPDPGVKAQFRPGGMVEYCASTGLGRAGRNQVFDSGSNPGGSILSGDDATVNRNLGRILEHPALPGQTRGRFMLLSAGKDGVYFSAQDGPGTQEPGMERYNVGEDIDNDKLPPNIFAEYDDVLIFGGSS